MLSTSWKYVAVIGAMVACVGLASPATAQMYDPGRRPLIQSTVQALSATSVIVPGNLLQNPSFELNGGGNSTTFSNWTIFNINLNDGSFFVQSGTTVAGAPPLSGSGATVPAPTDGNFAAMSNKTARGCASSTRMSPFPWGERP